MENSEKMQQLIVASANDEEGLIVAKIIIMIYEINNKGNSATVFSLRKQYGLENWNVEELSHKDALPAVSQQLRPDYIRRMEEFVTVERRFFNELKKFILPTFINDEGQEVAGGWARLQKYLNKDDINAMSDYIHFLTRLDYLYNSYQFMQHPVIKNIMDRFRRKSAKCYVSFLGRFSPSC